MVMTRAAHEPPGWFGKIAALGDFASRRLPGEAVRALDDWLARGLAASQARLGEGWLDVYLTAPVWRFAWAPGCLDGAWWFGVLLPSCDSVGRYFPLVVAQRRAQPPRDRIALDHLELWWQHVAAEALATLGEGSSLDGFEDALAHSPPWPTPGVAAALQFDEVPGAVRLQAGPATPLAQLMGDLAQHELAGKLHGQSLWWPLAEPGERERLCVAQGLPDPQVFADLLGGGW